MRESCIRTFVPDAAPRRLSDLGGGPDSRWERLIFGGLFLVLLALLAGLLSPLFLHRLRHRRRRGLSRFALLVLRGHGSRFHLSGKNIPSSIYGDEIGIYITAKIKGGNQISNSFRVDSNRRVFRPNHKMPSGFGRVANRKSGAPRLFLSPSLSLGQVALRHKSGRL